MSHLIGDKGQIAPRSEVPAGVGVPGLIRRAWVNFRTPNQIGSFGVPGTGYEVVIDHLSTGLRLRRQEHAYPVGALWRGGSHELDVGLGVSQGDLLAMGAMLMILQKDLKDAWHKGKRPLARPYPLLRLGA